MAITTTKTLRLNFKDETDKSTSLTLTGAKDGLSEEDIRPVMETIAGSGVFSKSGVKIYAKLKSAEYVERNIDTIFNDDENNGSEQA